MTLHTRFMIADICFAVYLILACSAFIWWFVLMFKQAQAWDQKGLMVFCGVFIAALVYTLGWTIGYFGAKIFVS